MNTTFKTILTVTALVSFGTFAQARDHGNNGNANAPGQASKSLGWDINGDGKSNGKDFAPGQLADTFPGLDRNGDGTVNGKDHAPGKNK